MLIRKYVVSFCLLMLSAGSFAHGLMESPASRNWFCGAVTKPDEVGNGTAKYPQCATAFAVNSIAGYSFMSVLNHHLGASEHPPKNVCSADSETWKGAVTPWDVPMDWPTNPITAGKQNIVWNISWGPHFSDTLDFKYWITKSDFVFSPDKALSWSDFESTPFCVLPYDHSQPNANPDVVPDEAAAKFTTSCTIPSRSGHHVIYGEWGRTPPTYERFHGCVDVAFGGTTNPVSAAISASPSSSTVTGATTITFSAAGSSGSNLTYQWSVESPNSSLYSFSSTTAANTTLTLKSPSAQTSLTVRVTVTSGSNSASKTLTFTHSPSAASSFVDLGAVTSTSRTLQVGDKVQLRLVDSDGVDSYFPASPLVITSATASSSAWTYALAQAVNDENSNVQVGTLADSTVTAAQSATGNRVYATLPSSYVSVFLNVVSGNAASSSLASSSRPSNSSSIASSRSSSSVPSSGGSQCNWYGMLYPLCATTTSGWGWENSKSCIATVTCSGQPAPYGVVGGSGSSTATTSAASSQARSSSSVVTTSSSRSSVANSSVASSARSSSSSATGASGNCTYVVKNEWNDGAEVNIVIKNNGSAPINGWNVSWSYANGTTVASSYNANLTGSNPYSAANLSWNSTIQPGQSQSFGFNTKKGSTTEKPTITGSVCN